jgi:hypothetical protein
MAQGVPIYFSVYEELYTSPFFIIGGNRYEY